MSSELQVLIQAKKLKENKIMKKITCFIGGIVTVALLIPILTDIASIIDGWTQTIISKFNLSVTNDNKKVLNIQEQIEKSNTNAIGFTVNWGDEAMEDDE